MESAHDYNDVTPVEDEPDLIGDNDAFLARVNAVHSSIKDDDEAFKRCVAEIYVFICTMEQGMRKMITAGGPLALLSKVGGMK
jgi:hypothetical protein